jgi:alpha-beta hydrolase superfamily lysophospholipase
MIAMLAVCRALIFLTLLLCMTLPATASPPNNINTLAQDRRGEAVVLGVKGQRVFSRVFLSPKLGQHPRLIVVIHGDAPLANPTYQYGFARSLSNQLTNTVVLALLRPGYSDGAGGQSDGSRGLATGDNYTSDVTKQLNQAVSEAATRWQTERIILIGHSGGAAIAMLMLANQPGLASSALILSCPCDLKTWRRHMAARQLNPLFLWPTSKPIAVRPDRPCLTVNPALFCGRGEGPGYTASTYVKT